MVEMKQELDWVKTNNKAASLLADIVQLLNCGSIEVIKWGPHGLLKLSEAEKVLTKLDQLAAEDKASKAVIRARDIQKRIGATT
jgi:hypothetical protein